MIRHQTERVDEEFLGIIEFVNEVKESPEHIVRLIEYLAIDAAIVDMERLIGEADHFLPGVADSSTFSHRSLLFVREGPMRFNGEFRAPFHNRSWGIGL